MTTTYPTVSDIEFKWRSSASGICVIVEGETYREDPWFYQQWFGDRAQKVTFFPQNGWEQVVTAVLDLRARLSAKSVYGIVDRDFADDAALDADFASKGILRTRYYTIENYLLNPDCWAAVFAFVFRRHGDAPKGWDDSAQVEAHIERCYHQCLSLAAHNRVIKYGCEHYPCRAAQTPEHERTYREHPDSLSNVDPAAKLAGWGVLLKAAEDFGAMFTQALSHLEKSGMSLWEQQVSGKYVLKELHRRFPRLPGSGQFSLDHYLNEYLRECPEPPEDLVALVDLILHDAHS